MSLLPVRLSASLSVLSLQESYHSGLRSEERRVGKECTFRCISRSSPYT